MILVNEGFEGTGYEETWAETVSGGNIVDEDSTTIACFGSQCLKSVATSAAAPSAFTLSIFGNSGSVYAQAWIYITENGLTIVNENTTFYTLKDSSGNNAAWCTLRNTSGSLEIRFNYYSNGATVTISKNYFLNLNTWYFIRFRYDTINMIVGCYINNILFYIGNLSGLIRTPNRVVVGFSFYGGTAQSTIYVDNVKVDSSIYPDILNSSDPLVIEVPSTTVLFTSMFYIKSIRWVDATTAGHTVVLADKNGRTLWASEASGNDYVDSFLYEGWIDGLQVPTLASGKVYLQIG